MKKVNILLIIIIFINPKDGGMKYGAGVVAAKSLVGALNIVNKYAGLLD